MGRAILGTIIGYAAIVAVVMAGLGLAWKVLGAAGSFSGDGPYPSNGWVAAGLLSGFLAAFVGGLVARKIGRDALAVKILVGLLLVLGLWGAVTAERSYAKRAEKAVDRPIGELSFMEAGMVAKNPSWYNWVIPFLGAAGVLLGGRERQAADSAPV